MLENCQSKKERWGGVSKILDRWLEERQKLIVLLCEANDAEGNVVKGSDPLPQRIQTLCQILVDYVSAGHFEVYEQLNQEGMEFNDGGLELAKKLYPAIDETTEVVLDFNDKYDNADKVEKQRKHLHADLSKLGQTLEERFSVEDQLVEALHSAHKELVA